MAGTAPERRPGMRGHADRPRDRSGHPRATPTIFGADRRVDRARIECRLTLHCRHRETANQRDEYSFHRSKPARQKLTLILEDGIGGGLDEMAVHALQIAQGIEVQRTGLDRLDAARA